MSIPFLMFFLFIAAFIILVITIFDWKRYRQLKKHGIHTAATVAETSFSWGRGSYRWRLSIQFNTPHGIKHTDYLMLTPTVPAQYAKGKKINIIYDTNNYSNIYIVGDSFYRLNIIIRIAIALLLLYWSTTISI